MKLYMIRHGATAGNLSGRYIGVTDEPLHADSVGALLEKGLRMQNITNTVYVSPRVRCIETAALLFPDAAQVVADGLAECNFGLFENKCHEELLPLPLYQRFLQTGGESGFPQGESMASFSERVNAEFEKLVRRAAEQNTDPLVFVVHGGTIMAVLEKYARPKKTFYEWHVKNGEGYTGTLSLKKNGTIEIKDIESYV